jgi:hypothetical protein
MARDGRRNSGNVIGATFLALVGLVVTGLGVLTVVEGFGDRPLPGTVSGARGTSIPAFMIALGVVLLALALAVLVVELRERLALRQFARRRLTSAHDGTVPEPLPQHGSTHCGHPGPARHARPRWLGGHGRPRRR